MNFATRFPFRPPQKVIRFPRQPAGGWTLACARCGAMFRLPYRAATIRGGRERLCPTCWLGEVRQ